MEILGPEHLSAIEDARRSERGAYLGFVNPKSNYAATLISEDGQISSGGYDGSIAAHPTYPIKCAKIALINSRGSPTRLNVKDVVVVATGHQPEVPYKDRQDLIEFSDMVAAATNSRGPLPITLVELDKLGKPVGAWRTDSHAWLPHPFTPRNLGLEDQLIEAMGRLR